MSPVVARAQAWAVEHLRRLRDLVRRHPVRAALLLPVLLLAYVLVLIPFTPSISDLRKAKSEVPSVVMSADGVVLAEFRRINRQWVPLNKISPYVIEALIATEDRRFYEHHGGSTITQQLARNMFPQEIGRAPSLTRKIKEAITAVKIEAIYSKDEIL